MAKLNEEIKKNSDPSAKQAPVDIRNMLTSITQFHGVFEQMKMHLMRQKELKESLNVKLNEIKKSKEEIESLYHQIESTYKPKITDVSKTVSYLERSNYEINNRLFLIEKDNEKQELKNKLELNGITVNEDGLVNSHLEPQCVSRNSCKVCLDNPNCVWCGMERRCTAGGITGPKDGGCMSSFEYNTCSQNSCNYLTSCAKCVQNDSCGWCGSTNRCVEGNSYKASVEFCPSDYKHKNNKNQCLNSAINHFLN